jgi:methyl-accepting chemotaxis protein
MRLSDYSIGTRSLGAFGILVALLIALGGISYIQIEKVYFGVTDLGTNWMPAIKYLGKMEYFAARARGALIGEILSAHNSEELDKYILNLKGYRDKYDEQAKLYVGTIADPVEQALYDDVASTLDIYRKSTDSVIELVRTGKNQEASVIAFGDGKTKFSNFIAAIEKDIKFQDDGAAKAMQDAAATNATAKTVTALAVAIAVIIGIGSYFMITSTVSSPVTALEHFQRTKSRQGFPVA